MNVAQMIRHCSQWDEMAHGKTKYKQSFIGRLFGRRALKSMMNDAPIKKNLPTVPTFRITEPVDIDTEREKWIALLEQYAHFNNEGFVHPFFGPMSKEATGYVVYKHIDHHLKQFGA